MIYGDTLAGASCLYIRRIRTKVALSDYLPPPVSWHTMNSEQDTLGLWSDRFAWDARDERDPRDVKEEETAMTALLLMTLGVFAAPGERQQAGPAAAHKAQRATLRPYTELTADVRAALRREATRREATRREATRREAMAQSMDERESPVLELISLYNELQRDPRRQPNTALDRLRLKVRVRLARVKDEIQKELVGLGATTPSTPSPSGSQDYPAAAFAQEPIAPQTAHRGGAAVAAAQGAALVELIERTISPDIWDVNGGPATVVYFAPRHALVVRAPSEIHDRVDGLLRGLREAN